MGVMNLGGKISLALFLIIAIVEADGVAVAALDKVSRIVLPVVNWALLVFALDKFLDIQITADGCLRLLDTIACRLLNIVVDISIKNIVNRRLASDIRLGVIDHEWVVSSPFSQAFSVFLRDVIRSVVLQLILEFDSFVPSFNRTMLLTVVAVYIGSAACFVFIRRGVWGAFAPAINQRGNCSGNDSISESALPSRKELFIDILWPVRTYIQQHSWTHPPSGPCHARP